jgi:hypothetical protein
LPAWSKSKVVCFGLPDIAAGDKISLLNYTLAEYKFSVTSMMRNRLFLFWIIVCFSCNNNGTVNGNAIKDTVEENEYELPVDKLIWITDYDSLHHRFVLKKQRTLNVDTLHVENLVAGINAAWDNIKLVFIKISNDTVYVAIPESNYLTQQMGTAGAQSYMSATTYSLTELAGIKFVNYSFEEGDHMAPGVYSREDFKEFQ